MRISDWSSDVCSSDLKITDLEQDRRHHRGLQDGEAGESVGVAQQLGLAADLLHQVVGELLGQIHGLALGQIDEYIPNVAGLVGEVRSEEHTSELQSLMRISYAVFCLKKNKKQQHALDQ